MTARNGASKKSQVETQEMIRQVLDARKAGMSFAEIARAVDPPYSDASGAFRAYQRGMKQMIREPAEDVKNLELARLDTMLKALWPAVLQGKWLAIDRALAIMDRRARMLGLDAPLRQIVEVVTEEAIDRAIEELEARAQELDGLVPPPLDSMDAATIAQAAADAT